jgi:PAS domain S-box-containing protein
MSPLTPQQPVPPSIHVSVNNVRAKRASPSKKQVLSDNTEQQDLISLEKEIFQLNMQPGISIREVTNTLLEKIEKLYPGTICSVLRLESDNTLTHYAAPSLPAAYTDLINGVIAGPKAGSCGTAVHENKAIIVSDIQNDPLWEDYKFIAAQFGLKSCWSVPIQHSKGRILGSFAIYHLYISTPTESMLKTIERLAFVLGILIENNENVESLRLSNERYNLVAQATHDMIWDWDLQKNEIFRNEEGLRTIYGFSTNEPIRRIDNWVERIHADDRHRVQQAIAAIHHDSRSTIFQVEYRFLRGDSNYVSIYDRGYIMRDADGKPIRVIGAAQDITERVRLQDQLMEEKNLRQEEIMKATLGVQEKERNEIGYELHDNVNQILTSAKLYLECVGRWDDKKEEYRLMSLDLINKSVEEIRRLSKSLVQPRLNDVGLVQAIDDILENIRVTRQLSIVLQYDGFDETSLDHGLKLAIYRIIQEQTTNIIKHAQASAARIELYQEQKDTVLKIVDNGLGFDPSLLRKGIGFTNIINRSAVHHGKVVIDSAPGKGCSLSIFFNQDITATRIPG